MQMHHLNAKHEVHSQIYNEWLDINAQYVGPTMEAKDVIVHLLAELMSLLMGIIFLLYVHTHTHTHARTLSTLHYFCVGS